MKTKILITTTLLLSLFATSIYSQQNDKLEPDPKVIKGHLNNGLTYYICKNTEPANRAEFFIAQKVGSILEDSTQLGLAHFLEHMAFNGTKNFPKKEMINYLETIGVKFGENLNASTGFDETVYNISNVPTIRNGIIDSCLLILHDWSCGIALENSEIDSERGVITEEWRARNNAGLRIFEAQLKDIYAGSQYANRLPIGDMNIVNTFPYKRIQDYYKKWYRPDLQAILIVGDINPEYVESRIKSIFGKIPAPVNPAFRIRYTIEDNLNPIISIRTDKEARNSSVRIFYKQKGNSDSIRGTNKELEENLINSLINSMIGNRLYEASQKSGSKIIYPYASFGDFYICPEKQALTAGAMYKEGEAVNSMSELVTEIERARRYGFTPSEYERAKADVKAGLQSIYNERNKQENNIIVQELIKNFTRGEANPGIEYIYNYMMKIMPGLGLDQINEQFARYSATDSNIVIMIDGPQKDSIIYPTKEETVNAFNLARNSKLEPYKDTTSNEPLIPNLRKAGTIKKIEKDALGNTVWILSNGVRVTLKPTDFKENEILMSAKSEGGYSLLSNADIPNYIAFNDIVSLGGLGNFSTSDLQKRLAGKLVDVSVKLNNRDESIFGYCSATDFKEMMQLTYLWFTDPRMDTNAFNSFKETTMLRLNNMKNDPMTIFSDTLRSAIYGKNPRVTDLTPELLEKVDYNRVMQILKDRFKDANNFNFTLAGNLNTDSIKPYILQYLGSLPAVSRIEKAKDQGIYPKPGILSNHFKQKMENPKAVVYTVYTGKCPYTLDNIVKMSMLSQILNIIYTDEIREKEGGTYGVSVNGEITREPKQLCNLTIHFETSPEQSEKLISIVYRVLDSIASSGPKKEVFYKVQQFMLKKQEETLRENKYWLDAIDMMNESKINMPASYKSIVEKMTPGDIQSFTKMILDQKNRTEVIMKGVTE